MKHLLFDEIVASYQRVTIHLTHLMSAEPLEHKSMNHFYYRNHFGCHISLLHAHRAFKVLENAKVNLKGSQYYCSRLHVVQCIFV